MMNFPQLDRTELRGKVNLSALPRPAPAAGLPYSLLGQWWVGALKMGTSFAPANIRV